VKIEIYTDGSCRGNPGPGGWGAIILYDNHEIQLAEQCLKTTNQEMELVAAANGLFFVDYHLKMADEDITLYTDSAYFYCCWKDEWWKKWQWNGWLNSKGLPVANKGVWELLIPWFKKSNFSIVKVKGHSANEYNEKADRLATGEVKPIKT